MNRSSDVVALVGVIVLLAAGSLLMLEAIVEIVGLLR